MESRIGVLKPPLPEAFLDRMRGQLCGINGDFPAFLAAYEDEPWRGVRVNLLKTNEIEPYLKGVEYTPVPWFSGGFAYRQPLPLGHSLPYLAGLFYMQEPSAMSSAAILDAQPGERVLDLCAAPGGKTTQIAGAMLGEGLLVANDASSTRVLALVRNMERAGVRNAVITAEQPRRLAERFPGFFDRVLVDAPCSGEGMFRRETDVLKAYTHNKPETCAVIQADILKNAATMVKHGGRLVYSTCTFNKIENENIIDGFLLLNKDFKLLNKKRIWPHKDIGEGHFVALLSKEEKPTTEKNNPKNVKGILSGYEIFTDFCNQFLNMDFKNKYPVINNKSLYLQHEPLDLKNLRTIRSGWLVGEISKGRFVPSQALAMGLQKTDARYSVNLTEPDAERYVKGESLEYLLEYNITDIKNEKPWILMCYGNHPLGWARLVQNRLKNQLPVGWVR
jgi:16S rRNA C967 or C1407 C5-methylase (RsmB/RsmF family)/NOL1/NOP2/fmu family ribosome biogenesis protein